MLTRKDYRAIAAMIHQEHHAQSQTVNQNPIRAVERIGIMLADYMAQDNPNFDRDKFIAACYGEK